MGLFLGLWEERLEKVAWNHNLMYLLSTTDTKKTKVHKG